MTLNELNKVLEKDNFWEYIYVHSKDRITLDGWFSVEQLERLLRLIEQCDDLGGKEEQIEVHNDYPCKG